jgi:hypothetical protein
LKSSRGVQMKWNVTPEKEDSYCVPKERQLLCKSEAVF